MVTPTGRVKLLDFGLSRWTPGGRARSAGGAGETRATLGSIAYMSPEQSLGGKVDQRTDVFSLGSVLFQMLTAQAPFAKIGNESTPVQVLQRVLPGPSSVNPRVPPELDDVLRGALMKNPNHREASAAKLSANLKTIAVGLEALSPPPVPPAAGRSGGSSHAGRWLLLVIIFALMLVGWNWRDEVIRFWLDAVG